MKGVPLATKGIKEVEQVISLQSKTLKHELYLSSLVRNHLRQLRHSFSVV